MTSWHIPEASKQPPAGKEHIKVIPAADGDHVNVTELFVQKVVSPFFKVK